MEVVKSHSNREELREVDFFLGGDLSICVERWLGKCIMIQH